MVGVVVVGKGGDYVPEDDGKALAQGKQYQLCTFIGHKPISGFHVWPGKIRVWNGNNGGVESSSQGSSQLATGNQNVKGYSTTVTEDQE